MKTAPLAICAQLRLNTPSSPAETTANVIAPVSLALPGSRPVLTLAAPLSHAQ
ncbi:hypothetical protein IMCC9480_1201 [Oxalobacteraceae bacterium IMCC9480]|nr:hypothetical protein IMCC9480_1201 [Oxalobacteraceae bacterium IMCC9480]